MAFIFLLFLYPNFLKAEIIESDSYSETNNLEKISTKEFLKNSFLKDIPRTKVSAKEKSSLITRDPFLPFEQNISNGKSRFNFSQINLTGIVSMNGEKVAFIKTSKGTNPYQEGEIIGSEFKLINIDDKNLTIEISNDISTYSMTLEEDGK